MCLDSQKVEIILIHLEFWECLCSPFSEIGNPVAPVKTWQFTPTENLLPYCPPFLMKFCVNKEKENHVSDDVVREGSNNLSPSQAGEVCLDHIQRMTMFEFSGVSSALARESSTCLRCTREICLEDREWLLFFPISNVSMCGLGQGGERRGLGKLVVAYRGLSFPVENLSRLSECHFCILLLLFYPCSWDVEESCLQGFFWLYMLLCQEESVFSLSQENSISF